jgi:hypothetical protein
MSGLHNVSLKSANHGMRTLLLGLTVGALSICAAVRAVASTGDATPGQAASVATFEESVATGYALSLERTFDSKREANVVSDCFSAEDTRAANPSVPLKNKGSLT